MSFRKSNRQTETATILTKIKRYTDNHRTDKTTDYTVLDHTHTKHTDRQTDRQTDLLPIRQTDGSQTKTDQQKNIVNRRTGRQTNTNRQTDTLKIQNHRTVRQLDTLTMKRQTHRLSNVRQTDVFQKVQPLD